MHWILQDNLFNEQAYLVLLETLERFNISHSIHKVIPFIGELDPPVDHQLVCQIDEVSSRACQLGTHGCITDHQNIICMGSYSLRHPAKANNWHPGVFDLEPFTFVEQLKHWGDHMLNADADVLPFRDVLLLDASFIRPIEDSKVFAGAMFYPVAFHDWQQKVCDLTEDDGTSLTPDTLVQVCRPKKIYAEYRFWIVNGKIVTASLYKQGRRVFYASEVDKCYYNFVQARINEWQPLATFVIDVCGIMGDESNGFHLIKIVEINTLNSAGLYAADIQKLVMALEDAYSC